MRVTAENVVSGDTFKCEIRPEDLEGIVPHPLRAGGDVAEVMMSMCVGGGWGGVVSVSVCVCVCVCVLYIYIYRYVCMYVCMYVYIVRARSFTIVL
jgi:hypothetical protein